MEIILIYVKEIVSKWVGNKQNVKSIEMPNTNQK